MVVAVTTAVLDTETQALSNQKMYEMRAMFGEEAVGLQTGDTSLRPDAQIVIMTTEILRNILYRAAEEDALRRGSADANGAEQPQSTQQSSSGQLASIGLVVLDEVHYLADPNRGSVWEEVIINCPPSIQLLAMSATVRNPADLGGWIGKVVASTVAVAVFMLASGAWSMSDGGQQGPTSSPALALLPQDPRLHAAAAPLRAQRPAPQPAAAACRGQAAS